MKPSALLVCFLATATALGLSYLILPNTFPSGELLVWMLIRIAIITLIFSWIASNGKH